MSSESSKLWVKESDLERFAGIAPASAVFVLIEAIEWAWNAGAVTPATVRDWVARN